MDLFFPSLSLTHPSVHPSTHPPITHSVPVTYLFYCNIQWRNTLELWGDIPISASDWLSKSPWPMFTIKGLFHRVFCKPAPRCYHRGRAFFLPVLIIPRLSSHLLSTLPWGQITALQKPKTAMEEPLRTEKSTPGHPSTHSGAGVLSATGYSKRLLTQQMLLL